MQATRSPALAVARRLRPCLLLALLAACGHARDAEIADPGDWNRQMPQEIRRTAVERGIVACRLRAPVGDDGERPCAPLSLLEDDKIYVTTAIKQERSEPDAGFETNFYRDVWSFCFIVVRGDSSSEYLADYRRGVFGPSLVEVEEGNTVTPARVVVSMTDGYLDKRAKLGCDWMWRFTETPQIG